MAGHLVMRVVPMLCHGKMGNPSTPNQSIKLQYRVCHVWLSPCIRLLSALPLLQGHGSACHVKVLC